MISLMILVIIVPLISPPKPDNPSSGSTHINGADGLTTDPDPTLIPARDLMMASSSLTHDSSATHDHASDSGSTELSGGYSDGDRAMTSSQNPYVPESHPPMVRVHAAAAAAPPPPAAAAAPPPPAAAAAAAAATTTTTSSSSPFKLRNKSLILSFETALALITIRFQALGNSVSTTLLSSFLYTMIAATTVFAFTFSVMGFVLEGVHQAAATVCSYAGLISIVLAFFFVAAAFIPERFVWLVWAACVVLALVFVYSIAKRTCNTSAASTTPSSV